MRIFLVAAVIITTSLLTAVVGTQLVESAGILSPAGSGAEITWTHLSSKNGDLDPPGNNIDQTAALAFDVNKDGVNDIVIGNRRTPGPSMVWYKREPDGWQLHVIDSTVLNVEAGGTYHDIDRDGDLDVVMGGDSRSNEVWWWENPFPDYNPAVNWARHLIKESGADKHHDQMFGDFDDDGDTEFLFWNQEANKLVLAEIPLDPRSPGAWLQRDIYTWSGVDHEGFAQADIDLDGLVDIVGGGRWFKYDDGTGDFTAHTIDAGQTFGRVAAGQLVAGGRPEAVFVIGDGVSRIKWYEWNGSTWDGTDLLGFDVDHGHSLQIMDVDLDGNLDIFNAEMRLDGGNADAKSWVFYGDGAGNFTTVEVSSGIGNHESKMADLDGDGFLDILDKPFNWDTPRLDIWLNNSTCDQRLDQWRRHVIDPARPERAIFVLPGDLDQDGLQDVVSGAWWYRNPGTPSGTWVRQTIGSPLNNVAAVHDFDGDGAPDILGTEGVGSRNNADFVWAHNSGGGSFTIHDNIDPATGNFLQGVAINEFITGTLDVALSWHDTGPGVQALAIPADPLNESWDWRRLSTTSQGEEINAGDIDRDGDNDLLLGTRWLENDSATGTWEAHDLFLPYGEPDRNHLAHMNDDGRLDAVVGYEAKDNPGKLAWYKQPQTATDPWTEMIIATDVIGPMSLDVADMDGDGDMDIVVGEHYPANEPASRILVYEHPGDETSAWTRHVVSSGDEHHDGAQLVDIDNDGDLDILSIGWEHGRVLLYENEGCAIDNLALNSGWNTISTKVRAQDPQITSILSAVEDDILLVINNDGQVYWPELNANDITFFDVRQGYQIKMKNPVTLSISGLAVDPSQTPIDLMGGWNLVAYLRQEAMPVDQALSSISDKLYLVKNGMGRTYWPFYGVDQIGDLQPGQSYHIYMIEPGTLLYPAN